MDPEDEGEDRASAPLLPPDDRLWRHPSEVAGGPLPPGRAAAAQPPRIVTIVALTTCISVLMSVALLAVVGPVRTRVAIERVASPEALVAKASPFVDVAALAEQVRPAITQVIASGPSGEQWGSGVIYRSDGMMFTAHGVVAGADSVRVRLDDGREVFARLVGSDPHTDIALMRLEGDSFAPALLGSSAGLKLGHPAIIIGSAPGAATGPVVRVGMVSAVAQQVESDGRTLFDMIQTDGALAPGSVGGAVVDSRGAVIGIAAANATTEAGVIGYATPVDVARTVGSQLIEEGRVSRSWLGIEGDALAAERAKQLGVGGGVLVKTVKPGGPAEAAGLSATEVITSVQGRQVTSMSDLVVLLRSLRPGDTISLSVVRGDGKRTVKVRLGRQPG